MIWSLALQSLRLRPLRTFLTALGIAVAVASTVIFLSLGEGLRQVFSREIGGIGPAIQVSYGPFDTTALTAVPELPLRFAAELRAKRGEYGITRVTPILLYARGGFSPGSSFLFQGLPPALEVGSLYFDYAVVEGRGLTRQDETANVAVVGEQVAERNSIGVGDTLRLNPESSLEIVGVARSGGGLVDNAVIVPLESLQAAIGIRNRVSFLALDLDEPARAGEVAAALTQAYPKFGFQTQGEVLKVLERGIRISDVVRLGISAIALIVGAIAVANTVLMSVFERTREFGVIRAVGAKPTLFIRVGLKRVCPTQFSRGRVRRRARLVRHSGCQPDCRTSNRLRGRGAHPAARRVCGGYRLFDGRTLRAVTRRPRRPYPHRRSDVERITCSSQRPPKRVSSAL